MVVVVVVYTIDAQIIEIQCDTSFLPDIFLVKLQKGEAFLLVVIHLESVCLQLSSRCLQTIASTRFPTASKEAPTPIVKDLHVITKTLIETKEGSNCK